MRHIFSFLLPKSKNEDDHRIEFIFNVLVASIIILLFCGLLANLFFFFFSNSSGYKTNTVSWVISFSEILTFFFLYFLSRKGFFHTASYLFLSILFILVTYTAYRWGVDLPYSIAGYVMVITMTGVLINARFAFISTGVIGASIFIIGYFQSSNVLSTNRYWRLEKWGNIDTAVLVVFLLISATISWLSNREIEKSLKRARKSEGELKEERDSLEIKIEARTKELKEVQIEKMSQLYRMAEFGRISSGVFHDLINMLTVVSMNIEDVKKENNEKHKISETVRSVDSAILATRKMEGLIYAVRGQLVRKQSKIIFSLRDEIDQIIDILLYKARKANVDICFIPGDDVVILGDPLRFNQIVMNLIANAIESYKDKHKKIKDVKVMLLKTKKGIEFSVTDEGEGISSEVRDKIFEPFFTTKEEQGIGIGLSMTRHIVEKDFGGTIHVFSEKNKGTTFLVLFPHSQ